MRHAFPNLLPHNYNHPIPVFEVIKFIDNEGFDLDSRKLKIIV